jgi:hypothetical protein
MIISKFGKQFDIFSLIDTYAKAYVTLQKYDCFDSIQVASGVNPIDISFSSRKSQIWTTSVASSSFFDP